MATQGGKGVPGVEQHPRSPHTRRETRVESHPLGIRIPAWAAALPDGGASLNGAVVGPSGVHGFEVRHTIEDGLEGDVEAMEEGGDLADLEDVELVAAPVGSLTVVEWPEGGSGVLRDVWKKFCIVGWTPTYYYRDSGSRRMSLLDIVVRLEELRASDSVALIEAETVGEMPHDELQMYADTLYAMALKKRGLL